VSESRRARLGASLVTSLRDLRVILRGNAGVILFTWLILSLGFALIHPFFSLYVKMLGGTDVEIGLVQSAAALAGLVLMLPGGYITDKNGRRIIVAMTWCLATLFIFYALVQDWRQLLVLAAVDQALHFHQPALMAIVTDSLPPGYRGRGWAVSVVVRNAPWLFMPIVGGYLIDMLGIAGFRLGYLALALITLAAAAIRTAYLRETIEVKKRGGFSLSEMLMGYVDALRQLPRSVIVIMLERSVLGAFGALTLGLYGVIYAIEVLRISNVEWGVANSASTLMSLVVTLLCLSFIDRIRNRNRAIALAFFVSAIGILSFVLLEGFAAAAVSLVLVSLASSFIWPSLSALLGDLTPRELRGRSMAVGNVLIRLSTAAVAPVAGFLYSISPRLAFIAAALVTLGRAAVYLLFVREPKAREE